MKLWFGRSNFWLVPVYYIFPSVDQTWLFLPLSVAHNYFRLGPLGSRLCLTYLTCKRFIRVCSWEQYLWKEKGTRQVWVEREVSYDAVYMECISHPHREIWRLEVSELSWIGTRRQDFYMPLPKVINVGCSRRRVIFARRLFSAEQSPKQLIAEAWLLLQVGVIPKGKSE